DVLGVNYYSSLLVRAWDGVGERSRADGHADGDATPWVGADAVEFLRPRGPYTAMGWNIDPSGLSELLARVHSEYPGLPIMVTENGAAFDDELSADGGVHDPQRISYLHDHIAAVGSAIDDGIDVRGYFAGPPLASFEWSYGYERRFGLIYVDYATQKRIWKDSAHWYRDVIARNGLG